MITELKMDKVAGAVSRSKNSRVVRGRGCNESFRAAVDRSYEANQDSVVASQDCVVAQEVEDVALEVIQLERDKLDELLKLCQHEDNYLCSIM